MSLSVSARLAGVRPSSTGAVLARVAELRAAGHDVLSLGAGEPDFDTPAHICEAAKVAIDAGYTKYTPIDGAAELKAAIQRKFRRDNDLDYAVQQILVSSGGKQALFNLCLALLEPAHEAIVPAPYWVSYPDMVALAGAKPVFVESSIESGFKMTPEALRAALTAKTRLVFFNSPCNPTGAVYTRDEYAAFGAVLAEFPDVVVVSDDIYEHICWAKASVASFATACPTLADRTVTVNGVSKAYAMTGWRIGYAAGPVSVINAMRTIQSQSTSNPCSVSQAAAVAALDGDQAPVAAMRDAYRERHDFIVPRLDALPGVDCIPGDGAFYALPRVLEAIEALGLDSDVELAGRLVDEANVACVPGSAFGAPGHLRVSFACSMATLEQAVVRMQRVLAA